MADCWWGGAAWLLVVPGKEGREATWAAEPQGKEMKTKASSGRGRFSSPMQGDGERLREEQWGKQRWDMGRGL